MSNLLLDTHAFIWYLEKADQLTRTAQQAIRTALNDRASLCVSAVSLAEILYLEEKRRLAPETLRRVLGELRAAASSLVEVPFTAAMAEAMAALPYAAVPDMPDRMIAATALHLGLPLVTADSRLRATTLTTIW